METMKDEEPNVIASDNIFEDDSETATSSENVSETTSADSKNASAEETTEDNSETTVTVYVCGAVVNEGVYELPDGARLSDALMAAGGYDANALHGYVNLAKLVEDGERVYFPDYQEFEELGLVPMSGESSTGASNETAGDSISSGGKVNINTADAEQLKSLPGIGDTKAADIIAYREEHGSFGSIEDIQNVNGIGESTYNRISSYITVN
ncbi:MAG: ComEA family DNA-binding protein [Eubacterium sp.]|nr:ComEA family DNA-binding protein [Eubacterium sp.]